MYHDSLLFTFFFWICYEFDTHSNKSESFQKCAIQIMHWSYGIKTLVLEAKHFFLFFVTSTFIVSTFPRDNGFTFDYHQMYVEIDSLKTWCGYESAIFANYGNTNYGVSSPGIKKINKAMEWLQVLRNWQWFIFNIWFLEYFRQKHPLIFQ